MTEYRKHQNDIDLDHTKFSFHNAYHKTVVIPNYMMIAMRDLVKKRGFANISEFMRFAIRKEIDYQLSMVYVPQVKERITDI